MKNTLLPLLPLFLLVALAGLVGCGGDTPDEDQTGHSAGKQDDDAGHEDDHDDHDDHGEKSDRGTKAAGPAKVSLGLYGNVVAGMEAIMDIEVEDMKPEAVRVWIGLERAQDSGSMKSKLDGEGSYHGHVEVPAKLPDGSAIWIELEAPDGSRHRVSFDVEG